jgi:hypothetical protein
MSDREVEVSVQAEGVDDAAGELGGETAAGGGVGVGVPGDGGGRGGGLKGALAGGIIGGLLSQLKSVTNILEPILAVLNAFLAPISLVVMRLLQPVLRQFIKLLPAWLNFVNNYPPDTIGSLLGAYIDYATAIWGQIFSALGTATSAIVQLPSKIGDLASMVPTWGEIQGGLRSLRERLVQEITSLPSSIGAAVGNKLPGLPSIGGRGDRGGGGLFDGLLSRFDGDDSGGGGDGDGPIVNLEGGLGTFVDRFTKNPTFDFP